MAGCDAKTGWSKSEFRDICQNKLAQLSVDVFSPLGRALALHFRGKDKLVVPLFHCFCAEYQPSEHAAICRHIFQKVQALLSEIYSSLNIKVEFKYLPLTLAFTFIETIVLKKTLSGVKGLAQGPTAVLARLGTSGGFHTHAERFWEHDCLHSRWHFGINFAWKSTFILPPILDLSACANSEVPFLHWWSESHVLSEWASGRLHTSASERKAEVAPRSAFHVSINPKIDHTQQQLQQLFKHWRATYPWKNVEEEQKQVP